jgi:ribosomal-protein-alanine N-acetyltransferase
MTVYEIRGMKKEDIPQIARIEKLVFSAPWTEVAFRSELEDNAMALYLVLTDEAQPDNVLAYGGVWKIFDEGHITNIAVSQDYRWLGIGQFLCEALIRAAARRGLRLLTLEVREGNQAARSMYRKLGFTEAGRRRGYYQTPIEDAILMTREAAHGDEYIGL